MKEKFKILKTIEVNKEISVLVVKKVDENIKYCGDCPNFKYFGDLFIHYCSKHKGVVDYNDICIEAGM